MSGRVGSTACPQARDSRSYVRLQMPARFAILPGMADNQIERGELPGELTERFRAFSRTVDPEPSRTLPVMLVTLSALGVLVLIAAIVWIVLAN
jgi:hypothetical protein